MSKENLEDKVKRYMFDELAKGHWKISRKVAAETLGMSIAQVEGAFKNLEKSELCVFGD